MSDVRIAMVTSRYPYGGADQVAMLLVQALEHRHEVHFITTGEVDETCREGGHHRVVLALPRRQRFWHHYWNPSVVRKLKAHLARIEPDVVHFHSVANRTFSAAAILVSHDYPTVWSLHDVWSQCIWSAARPPSCEGMLHGCPFCRAMPGLSMASRFLKESVWRRAEVDLIVPSVWLGDRVAKSALSDKPMHVVPNGVPFERFAGADGTGVRHRLGIPPDVRVVLFAGQMQTNWKGYQDLLRIAARILETDENIWFVFVGPTGEPPRGHPRILFTGAVTYDEIPRYYAAADVFAYPTHADVFGLVVVEAMAAGLPVVTYRTGGVAELVLKGTTGFVIEEGDETGFETALRNLLDDPDRRRIMGRAARVRVKRHFTLDEQVARTEGLYGQVIAEREAKSGRTPGTREPLVSVVMPAYNTGRFIAQ
ncbi:MAG TPA: glycosyltransferase family 4 protein, partial [Planctomycetota bacterium]|nr:glycosyltransferase family 4 protein [Planctomycetota bacterium]